MRVLHIGTELTWRGGENQIRLLINGLAQKGVKNFVAYPKGSQALERFSGSVELCPLSSRSAFHPGSLRHLIRFVKTHKIDLIDAHSSGGHSLGLAVKRWVPEVKLVVHRRVDNVPGSSFFSRRKYLDPRVDRFVAISDAIRNVLIEYGVPGANIAVVKSAVDGSIFKNIRRDQCRQEWAERLKISPTIPLMGNASALTEQKGYEVLLPALAELRKEVEDFHFVIAGEGHLEAELKAMMTTLNLEKHVTFAGFIKEVPRLLGALDILCVPSNWEGLGTVILDGIWAGCAIAATRVGGIPEMIFHGETGMICEKGDSTQLKENLLRLLKEPDFRTSLIKNALAHAEKNFSLESMVQGNWQVYQSLF